MRQSAGLSHGLRRRRLRAASTVLIGIAIVAGLALAFRPAASKPERSIAVLPFVNLSRAADNEYFSDGLTEEISARLSASPELKVISRTSAMHYKGSTKSLRQIAAELGVAHVLEGSVRRQGDSVRITAQLIDAAADRHLWSRSYDRALGNVLGMQDEIAREVARSLEIELAGTAGAIATRGTRDPKAYEFYRRGRYFWNRRTKEGHEQAIAYFQQAIARDSTYAEAYAGLADAYLTSYQLNFDTAPEAEIYSRMRSAAQRALALDDQSADAHVSFGVALWWQKDWPGAEREIRRAIELNPGHATARSWYGLLLMGMGRLDEAVQQSRRATELDPFAIVANDNHGRVCYAARDYDCAIEQTRHALEVDGSWASAYGVQLLAYAKKGMYDEAMRAATKAVEFGGPLTPTFQARLAYVLALVGRNAEAVQVLQRAKAIPQNGVDIARAYVALGERDSAFAWLNRANWRWPFRGVLADPALDPLRSDPRFVQLSLRVEREMGIR
jgi:TolB-like protein/Flp pilus assembly protein TadD